ncbi:MAG: efflux RND transporter permease subunit [bacterium]
MWIVRIALERPYTFIVLAVLLFILGPLAILRTPTDMLPDINIPVVSVIWSYTGMPPDEMSMRITSNFERAVSTTVNDIEHIESQSLTGMSITKLFFHPNVDISFSLSQVTAISQTMLRLMPSGMTPPLILVYSASSVPVIQLALSSSKLSEQELNDYGNNFIRTQLATVQGSAMPYPYGGKLRQVQVDLNQQAMQTYGVSPQDVNNALTNQNLILPAGTQKIGLYEYAVKLNASTQTADALNDLPIKTVNNSTIYMRDVAHIRDGFSPQTNIVRIDGMRAVLLYIMKTGNASTLNIISSVKKLINSMKDSLPENLTLDVIGDQSVFVNAAINGVISEGVIAAILTGLMILLFLGSLHSTMIIAISIPLSVLASMIMLSLLGQTINVMTLGGLALAVGILVDDATVTVENINSHLRMGKDIKTSILDGASQIAVPAFVSTLCICIVFAPMFLLRGVAKFLFIPLAEAVVFAILASYFLSRTLVPTLAKYWLKKYSPHEEPPRQSLLYPLICFQQSFESGFERFRERYHMLLEKVLRNKRVFFGMFFSFLAASILLLGPWLGSDFFPYVDGGQIKLHLRAHSGLRVEETAKLCDEVDAIIRRVIPANELESIVDNVGMPVSGINLSYSTSSPIGPSDADILVSLKESHKPTADYVRTLRKELNKSMPSVIFAFLPADIVGQILNFGLPAPIDIQIVGFKAAANRVFANALFERIRHVPGLVDAHIQQAFDYPLLQVNVDRSRSNQLGFMQSDVATNMLISLSGSFQISPAFWLDIKNGVSYDVAAQTPQTAMTSLEDLRNILITGASVSTPPSILGALADISRGTTSAVETHYNVQPTIDIYASVQDRDLGAVSQDIHKIISAMSEDVPKGSTVVARGQMQTREASFASLYFGLVFSILLVYLLIVVNFQSWSDPFVIILALPAAIAGIVWMLFLTGTTLSVPALMGTIMCMGVATANSVLVISFARERVLAGVDPFSAALEAGYARLRPVIMTALAMIIGMIPMALGLGDGGEQNAPLGRAVIGGLLFATVATLFFVPAAFSAIHSGDKINAQQS